MGGGGGSADISAYYTKLQSLSIFLLRNVPSWVKWPGSIQGLVHTGIFFKWVFPLSFVLLQKQHLIPSTVMLANQKPEKMYDWFLEAMGQSSVWTDSEYKVCNFKTGTILATSTTSPNVNKGDNWREMRWDEIDFIYPRGEIQSPNSITYNIRKQHSTTFNDIQQHAGHGWPNITRNHDHNYNKSLFRCTFIFPQYRYETILHILFSSCHIISIWWRCSSLVFLGQSFYPIRIQRWKRTGK